MESKKPEEYIDILSSDGLCFKVPNCGLFSVINPEERVPIHSKCFKFINGEIKVPKSKIIKICQTFRSLSIDSYDQIIKSKLYEFLKETIDKSKFFEQHGFYFSRAVEEKYKNIFFGCIFDFLDSAPGKENFDFLGSANGKEIFDDFLIQVKNFLENEEHIKKYKTLIPELREYDGELHFFEKTLDIIDCFSLCRNRNIPVEFFEKNLNKYGRYLFDRYLEYNKHPQSKTPNRTNQKPKSLIETLNPKPIKIPQNNKKIFKNLGNKSKSRIQKRNRNFYYKF